MTDRPTEGATPNLARLEIFCDLKAISACYAVPSIVLSDAGSILVATHEEVALDVRR